MQFGSAGESGVHLFSNPSPEDIGQFVHFSICQKENVPKLVIKPTDRPLCWVPIFRAVTRLNPIDTQLTYLATWPKSSRDYPQFSSHVTIKGLFMLCEQEVQKRQ